MGRSPCCAKDSGLNRGAWTAQEDMILSEYIRIHGHGEWKSLPQKAGLKRCGKSCRMRWLNYLRPDIKRGNISSDEEELIIKLHGLLGNRWSLIARRLPERTDNEIKNYWNTCLSRKLANNGAYPKTKNVDERSTSPSGFVKDDMLKIIPVRPTALKIARDGKKSGDACNSDDQNGKLHTDATKLLNVSNSSWELLVDVDFEFMDFDVAPKNIVEADSPSTEVSGQYCSFSMSNLSDQQYAHSDNFADEMNTCEDFLHSNKLPSPDCGFLSSTCNSSTDVRIEETEIRPKNELEQQQHDVEWFRVSNGVKIEEIYNETQQVDWLDELEYFQMSSDDSLCLLEEEWFEESTPHVVECTHVP